MDTGEPAGSHVEVSQATRGHHGLSAFCSFLLRVLDFMVPFLRPSSWSLVMQGTGVGQAV